MTARNQQDESPLYKRVISLMTAPYESNFSTITGFAETPRRQDTSSVDAT